MREELKPRFVAILSCAAVSILALGMWLKPEKREQRAPSPSETATLQRIVRRQQVDNIAEVIAEAALDSSRYLVRTSGGTGLLWGGQVLVHPPLPATVPLWTDETAASTQPQFAAAPEGWAVLVAYAEEGQLVWMPATAGGAVSRSCHGITLRTLSLSSPV